MAQENKKLAEEQQMIFPPHYGVRYPISPYQLRNGRIRYNGRAGTLYHCCFHTTSKEIDVWLVETSIPSLYRLIS